MRTSEIRAAIGLMPTGVVEKLAGSTIPSGWLPCDGSVVAQADYLTLFATIGTTYNTGGEGAGNFRLPDLRGRFIRGLDNMGGPAGAASVDVGRTLGSAQNSSFGTHTHPAPASANNNASTGNSTFNHSHGIRVQVVAAASNERSEQNSSGPSSNSTTTANAPHSHPASVSTSVSVSVGDNENSSETRPVNVAVKYIIKA